MTGLAVVLSVVAALPPGYGVLFIAGCYAVGSIVIASLTGSSSASSRIAKILRFFLTPAGNGIIIVAQATWRP